MHCGKSNELLISNGGSGRGYKAIDKQLMVPRGGLSGPPKIECRLLVFRASKAERDAPGNCA